ncbi:MAG: hypothetical protein JRN52_14145 [Nitrososphaerota archaeon]|nr:hypothetical protein [Nitrososphaerota archaeon]
MSTTPAIKVFFAHAVLASERQERIEQLLAYARELLFRTQEPITEGFRLRIKDEAARRFRFSEATCDNYANTIVAILKEGRV